MSCGCNTHRYTTSNAESGLGNRELIFTDERGTAGWMMKVLTNTIALTKNFDRDRTYIRYA